MTYLFNLLKTHPATIGLLSSLGGVWTSFMEVLPDTLRVLNLVLAFLIGVISLALKLIEWRRKRRARIISPPDEPESQL